MLCDNDFRGRELSEKTLCLTFDDGPGPDTAELGRYLAKEGIEATFFVIGRQATECPEVLRQLRAWGHRLGNHSWSHAGLVDLVLSGGDVVEEIARADAVLRPWLAPSEAILLRPPYGSWRLKSRPGGPEDTLNSIVAEPLRRSGRFRDYLGPIKWDIVGEDWVCWRSRQSPEICARRQLEAIERIGRGIVLLHDSSEETALRGENRTGQMMTFLVPMLKRKGYRFVGLTSVPSIQAALEQMQAG